MDDGLENDCLILNITSYNGIWQGDNPFTETLPLFIKQLAVMLIVTRSLYHLFKPLHQPRIVSDILGGILLGPSALGKTTYFADLFPTRSVVTVETLGYMALVLHMFLVGLELDLTAIGRISKKAVAVTVTGLFLPFIAGSGFFYLLREILDHEGNQYYQHECGFLWAASLAVTSFPSIGQILSDLKLLSSEIGRMAMPIALISDLGSWILVVILIPICSNPMHAPYVITTTLAYVLASYYSFRPFLAWIVDYTTENKNYSDYYLCFTLVGVVLNAFVTDVTGTHPIVGAFIFGLIVPDDLALVLMDRFTYFISGIMMPVFFVIAGLRVDIFKITKWSLIFIVVIVLFAVKIISFLPISAVTNINTKDSFALGLLMSTKGVWAILIVLIGLDNKVLRDGDYAVTIIAILLMNSVIAPTIAAIYKRTKIFVKSNSRTIQEAKSEAELRVLVCIHSCCNVPGIVKLLGATHDSRRNHMTVFTLHLVELPGRPATMLIVHDSHSTRFEDSANDGHDYNSSETDQIVTSFTEFESKTRNVRIQSLTAVSPFMAMHGDICSLAEDKHVAFIILPFHKRATKEGSLRETISSFRNINQNVLLNAPCSVGVFIDRGLEEAKVSDPDDGIHDIAMLFLGGADDCEALAYAWRMSRKPGVSLTVIRLLENDGVDSSNTNESDEDYINKFKLQTAEEELIQYEEKTLNDGEQLIITLKEMENKFELFIVGRRDGVDSPITTDLYDRVECPELGVIGDLLAISDSATSSVLVVKKYVDAINNQVIEDLVGTQGSSMDRTAMYFGSRRIATATDNRLWLYSDSNEQPTATTVQDVDGHDDHGGENDP
ncbi:cation/hydrogen exchanger 15, CATION/H+ EXCHANGER 15 [Hibiscus trionum]|uniref:Cation/hydrogen exchanger 15, CATION/H+ EXCHANGER 15 n=1 Tax=Hibiscus trionum TaxID=183268 RepID=A0A9W7JGG1_HIBTR|nr:cation/hydrogen exchanger 15, CATION/H+ EXCHANGER 15 [Hibiscus trionum]